jgi:2-polyprenyl-3-methyl-5-hydroxy-6-metoxy-1,4-benzoquinol methylase
MLDLAALQAQDCLFDLGCGDGRLVIGAARRGARAVGVDLDASLVRRCQARAIEAGVSHRVEFRRDNFFEVDLQEATVITLYLLTSVNRALRPRLQALRPGTRIISHSFAMDDWQPDFMTVVECKELYHWTV